MHPHHSGGGAPMGSSQQLQDLQRMQQRMQQQVQAQLQQHQQGQQQMLGSSTGMGTMQGLSQMSPQMGFSNQQWLDPSHQGTGGSQQAQRNSLSGMSNYMMQQQNNSAQAALYWNALQSKGSTGNANDGGGASNSSMKSAGGGASGSLGMMDTSMQGLLQQQGKFGVSGNQQNHQMRSHMGQQQFGSGSGQHGNQQSDLSNSMLAAANAVVAGGNNTGGVIGGNTGMMPSSQQSGQLPSASSSSSTQLLLHQQNMIAELQRKLQEQQQNSGNANSSMGGNSGGSSLLSHGSGMERRSSSSSAQNLMSGQQQASLMQHRSSASSMLQQMRSGMMQDQGLAGAGGQGNSSISNLQGLQQQQRKSLGGSDQAMFSLMGSQNQQGSSQMRRSSNSPVGNALLGNMFGGPSHDGATGGGSNPAMLGGNMSGMTQHLSQMANLNASLDGGRAGASDDQFRAQQQLLGSQGMSHLGQDITGVSKAKQLPTGQTQSRSSHLLEESQGQPAMQRDSDPKENTGRDSNSGGAKSKGRRRSSASSKSKKASTSSSEKTGGSTQGQQSYLDGTFAGGWQSNVDLPDRRQIIYNIVKVIEQMRPDANKMSQKLPMMAKRLEEHLYRSAQTKEEYLDLSTLKKRLQMIAHGLEVHRSTSSGSNKKGGRNGIDPKPTEKPADHKQGGSNPDYTNEQLQQQLQQLQQLQEQRLVRGQALMDPQNHDDFISQQSRSLSVQRSSLSSPVSAIVSGSGSDSKADPQVVGSQLQENPRDLHVQFAQSQTSGVGNGSGILKTDSAKYQDATSSQKKKVIRQQQQRLLLLRHASKCTVGPSCKTKFCSQMVSLWKHMKKCRDKNCKTAHCLSSRCVLNHYRICKGENKTSTCEVCAPVMKQIKLQNSQTGEEPIDALARHQATIDPQPGDEASNKLSVGGSQQGCEDAQQKRQQLEELQAAQQKLQQQQLLLKQLQQQQAQLLEQQKQLQQQQQHVLPQTPQGQQLQEQEVLLQQLQQQFQQQQLLLQQELLRKSQTLGGQGLTELGEPAAHLDGNPDLSKPRKRASQSRKGSRKLSGSKESQGKGGRGRAGKGKRLSSMETASSDFSPSTALSDPVESAGSSSDLSRKRSVDAILSNADGDTDDTHAKIPKVEPVVSKEATEESTGDSGTTEASPAHEKVLQQGNEEHNTALIPSMTVASIEQHLESLHGSLHLTPRIISQKCLGVLNNLLEDQFGWVFRDPVDPVVLGLPDYFDVVKTPMHLALVEKRLQNALYKDMESFERDTKLVFENAILYNGEDSEVGMMAQSMLNRFEKDFSAVLKAIKAEQQTLKKKGDACSLCGSQRRLFEPNVLYCNGQCGMQKIRRNATYYTDKFKQNHWCVPCFALLKDDDSIVLDDGNEIRKKDLQKFKNDALPEEAWVQCDCCHNWVHQICALFNGRKNKMAATYTCPKCHIKKVTEGEGDKPEQLMKCARDLPECKTSVAIEKGLQNALAAAYEERALETGVSVDDVEKADGLSVRVVSNMEKKHFVRDEMYERYSKNGCPSEYPLRSKFIALFQTVHGVDVLLFGLYVYEYGHDCPSPNRRRVYISYLDSVHYFEPKCYRTITYHAILIEYLRHVKERGFHTAHIWSCPPSPGDDYIFYCHPSQQLIPRDDMLRAWYHDMLDKAKAQGIVLQTRTLFDEYFKNSGMDATAGPAVDPTSLPYFEGDYIPGEIENIIKELNDQEEAKRKDGAASKKVGKKLGTRSNPGELVSLGQDKVMLKLGQAISNMRQNFIVVHLRSRRFAAAVERGDDVSNWVDDHEEEHLRNKKMRISGKDSSFLYPKQQIGTTDNVAPVMEGKDDISVAQHQEKATGTDSAGDDCTLVNSNKESEIESLQGSSGVTDDLKVKSDPDEETAAPAEAEVGATAVDDTNKSSVSGEVGNKTAVESIIHGNESISPDMDRKDVGGASDGGQSDGFNGDDPLMANGKDNTSEGLQPGDENALNEAEKDGDASLDSASVAITPPPVEETGEELRATFEEDESKRNFGDHKVAEELKAPPCEISTTSTEDKDGSLTCDKEEPETKSATDADNAVVRTGTTSVSTSELSVEEKRQEPAQPTPSKRGFNEIEPTLSRHFASLKREARIVGSTLDEDELIENEMFESRQQFLNYCQTNHFQFDELRRAKHTTMMILFQLHNPNAPKFLQQCGSCYREITHGTRYHCNDCSNFDLCQDCYEPVITGLWAQRDSRFAHDESHNFAAIDMEAPLDTQKSREERSRALKVHLELLVHAGSCQGPPGCTLKNCEKMKSLFEHVNSCEITYKKGCKVCSRLLSLMTMHARQCTVRGECTIPFCDRIRERNRRLRQQQQQMDDRRRQAQNELYREGGSA